MWILLFLFVWFFLAQILQLRHVDWIWQLNPILTFVFIAAPMQGFVHDFLFRGPFRGTLRNITIEMGGGGN